VEQEGIVFIDEIDKIAISSDAYRGGADASSEGVQRDLLPIIEGSSVSSKYGNINTDKILFIASGAFQSAKPSDLLAELQGRLPIRVELKGLTESDLYKILKEPVHNLINQQIALMATEKVKLNFTEDGIKEIARVAAEINSTIENIGARRLHTVIEKIVEDLNFNYDKYQNLEVIVDEAYIKERVGALLTKTDLTKFIF